MDELELLTGALNHGMRLHTGSLKSIVRLSHAECNSFASAIVADIDAMSNDIRYQLITKISTPVPITERLLELSAFQELMSNQQSFSHIPALVRTQIIVQNYICFVYLPDALFHSLAQFASRKSVLARVSRFLTSKTIRQFRNAIAHGNWCYSHDFTSIQYWYELEYGSRRVQQSTVDQTTMNFWQSLSRCTAYCAFVALKRYEAKNIR